MSDYIGAFLVGIIYLAILYLLVKPGSDGATAIKTVSTALADLVKTATGSTNPA